MKEFSKILKELRIKNNESQKDLAEELNISFQSVSKWEQGVHYPDIIMIQDIAKHYNVTVDYLLGSANSNNIIENDKEELDIEVKVNEPGSNCVWTDFEYEGTIAPIALTDSSRHAPGNRYLKTHPGPKDTIVIGVDSNSRICLLGDHVNNSYPSCGPNGFIYTSLGQEGIKNDCLIIEEGYNGKQEGMKKFEFVIPKNGFVFVFQRNSIYAKKILEFVLPNRLLREFESSYPNLILPFFSGYQRNHMFTNIYMDELNNISISLSGNKLILEKEIDPNDLRKSATNKRIDALERSLESIERKINKLIDVFDDVECKSEEAYSLAEDAQVDADDAKCAADDAKCSADDAKSIASKCLEMCEKIKNSIK